MTLSPSDLDRIEELARGGVLAGVGDDGVDPGLILALVSMARQAPRWIPVEERLPEPEKVVLVFLHVMPGDTDTFNIPPGGFHYVDTASLQAQGFIAEEDYGPANVTHWMPLPAPPDEKPIVGRSEPAPPVEGRVEFVAERIVSAEEVDAVPGRRRHMLASHLSEMTSLLSGSLEESRIGRRDYRLRISVEPEG